MVALGVRVDLKVEEPDLLAAVLRAWSACVVTGTAGPPQVVLDVRTGGGDVGGTDLQAVMHGLSSRITRAVIARQAGQLLMFHAAALAGADGGAAVLVAASGTGKTTAATVLGRDLDYLTDETAGVRLDGSIVPYPKPLSVITEAGGWQKEQCSPDELGLGRPAGPCWVSTIVLLDRVDEHLVAPVLTSVPTLLALGALSPHLSSLGAVPTPLHSLATLIERTGGLQRVAYSEAVTLGPVVSGLLRGLG